MRLTLAVSNVGTTAAGELRIRTTLPEQAIFVASHPEPSAAEEGVLRFDLGELAAGDVRRDQHGTRAADGGTGGGEDDRRFLRRRPLADPHRPAPVGARLPSAASSRSGNSSAISAGGPQHWRWRCGTGGGRAGDRRGSRKPAPTCHGGSSWATCRRGRRVRSSCVTLRDGRNRCKSAFLPRTATARKRRRRCKLRCAVLRSRSLWPDPTKSLWATRRCSRSGPRTRAAVRRSRLRVACSMGDGLRLTVVDQQVQFAAKPGQLTWAIGRLAGGESRVLRFQARPVTAGGHLIRAAVENAALESGREQRPAAEKTITVRDRTADEPHRQPVTGTAAADAREIVVVDPITRRARGNAFPAGLFFSTPRQNAKLGAGLPTPSKPPTAGLPWFWRPAVGSVARSETGHNERPQHFVG